MSAKHSRAVVLVRHFRVEVFLGRVRAEDSPTTGWDRRVEMPASHPTELLQIEKFLDLVRGKGLKGQLVNEESVLRSDQTLDFAEVVRVIQEPKARWTLFH